MAIEKEYDKQFTVYLDSNENEKLEKEIRKVVTESYKEYDLLRAVCTFDGSRCYIILLIAVIE